uniref:Uncharacterized protein n=1 Tax=Oryza glumipatula TaxID=40148 RepID=A0A0D9Y5B1_9ORYZ
MSSCWASVAAALRRAPRRRTREPSLQEQLLAASERASVERLRERAGALQRELDAVAGETEEAEAAARRAEARAAGSGAALRAAAGEREAHEAKVRAVDEEIAAMDQRIRVLQAIVATITPK